MNIEVKKGSILISGKNDMACAYYVLEVCESCKTLTVTNPSDISNLGSDLISYEDIKKQGWTFALKIK